MSDIDCPYCGQRQEVCHDDGQGYAEGEIHQMECSKCEKAFTFTTEISFTYYPEKADCLNDGKHNFVLQKGHPEFARDLVCECGERKPRPDRAELYAKWCKLNSEVKA